MDNGQIPNAQRAMNQQLAKFFCAVFFFLYMTLSPLERSLLKLIAKKTVSIVFFVTPCYMRVNPVFNVMVTAYLNGVPLFNDFVGILGGGYKYVIKSLESYGMHPPDYFLNIKDDELHGLIVTSFFALGGLLVFFGI